MPRRKKVTSLGLVGAVILAAVLLLALSAPALAFPDVPTGHAYEVAVNDLSYLGVIGGYANGNFGLNDAVKRMQFAKMIVGTLGITPSSSTATRFTDLGAPDANGYPHKYVQAAYDHAITNGTNAAQTLFSPANPIRRDQVVSMIVRGAVSLYPGSLYAPPSGTLSLFDGVAEPHGENLRIAEYNGLLDGLIGMGPGWSVTATATRGEVAQMLWNLLDVLEAGPPPPSGNIWVYVDGTGDYPTIPAAVAGVDPGTTIYLGPGVFQLSGTLQIAKSLNLVGSTSMGTSVSTIAYGGGDVVSINALTFSAADIDFVSTSTAYAADVVVVRGGTADLSRCYFGGGTYVGQYGRGLYVDGYADVSVTDCAFTLNDMSGISVFDQASVSVYNCSMSDNGENGVTLAEDAVGVINQSECLRNALHGVSVNDYATLAIQNSKCSQNGSAGDYASGIYFEEYATGTINNCECSYNRIDGIALHEYAVATIQHATCNYNGTDGIALTENADGTISSCECSSNAQAGIWFGGFATGLADGNLCTGNYWGLYVDATSYPTVTANNSFYGNTVDWLYE